MTISKSEIYISPEDYLSQEKISVIRYEYIRGKVRAMTGKNQAHNTITVNVATLLKDHLWGTDCQVFCETMKVRIDPADVYYYPDVTVTCTDRPLNQNFIQDPCLIIEVLSDKTQVVDRSNKLSDYQQIKTLEEYVLIHSDRPQIECFRQIEKGRWELCVYREGDDVYFDSVSFLIEIAAIYEDVFDLS